MDGRMLSELEVLKGVRRSLGRFLVMVLTTIRMVLKGSFINEVHKNLGFLDPPPPEMFSFV